MIKRLKALENTEHFDNAADWYDRARVAIDMLACATGHGKATVANVVAVVSPQCSVNHNIAIAYAILTGQPAKGLRANIAKGIAIMRDPRAARVLVSGPKVSAFANALKGKSDLVLDVHALRAVGVDQSAIKVADRANAEKAYSSRAYALGMPIEAYQAGIWEAARVMLGRARHGDGCMLSATLRILG